MKTCAEDSTYVLFWHVNVGVTDLQLELSDRISHGHGHRSRGDDVVDLRVEVRHKVAGQRCVWRGRIVLYDLQTD